MRTLGLLTSLAVVAVFVLLLWIVGRAAGFQVSLVGSLVGSVVLTLLLNLVLGAFRRR